MIVTKIKQAVGEAEFDRAIALLASIPDKLHGNGLKSPDFIHKLPRLIDEENITIHEKTQLWLELVCLLPCYATWMQAFDFYVNELPEIDRPTFLKQIAAMLDEASESIATAVQYCLWVDFFENAETVSLSWQVISSHIQRPKGRRRLLQVSGPVPYGLKALFYRETSLMPGMEIPLIDAFHSCLTEVYGKVDKREMLNLLETMRVTEKPPNYAIVLQALS